jgi:hypothetical protein
VRGRSNFGLRGGVSGLFGTVGLVRCTRRHSYVPNNVEKVAPLIRLSSCEIRRY